MCAFVCLLFGDKLLILLESARFITQRAGVQISLLLPVLARDCRFEAFGERAFVSVFVSVFIHFCNITVPLILLNIISSNNPPPTLTSHYPQDILDSISRKSNRLRLKIVTKGNGKDVLWSLCLYHFIRVAPISSTNFMIPRATHSKKKEFMTDLLPTQRGKSSRVGFGFWKN